jgi:hypothetical protein
MTEGVPADELSDEDLERELTHIHEKRHDIFVSGTADQWRNNVLRTQQLERAYLQRFADRVPEASDKLSVEA